MSETYEFTGSVVHIGEEQTFSSGFNKIEFVLNNGADKYPQEIKFEAVKNRVADVLALQQGDQVKVTFDLRGREWDGKYFVNLNAWKVQSLGSQQSAPTARSRDDLPPLDDEDNIDEDVPF